MTLPFDVIRTAIRAGILQAGTNSQVIYYYPSAPRPSLPHTAIEITSWGAITSDWEETDEDTGLSRQYGFRELNVRLHFFGQNAYAEVAKVISGLERESIRNAMRAICSISILNSGPSDLTSDLVENSYEPRATVDVTYLVNLEDGSTQIDYGYFDTVKSVEWINKP
jgi:hypothetical protein